MQMMQAEVYIISDLLLFIRKSHSRHRQIPELSSGQALGNMLSSGSFICLSQIILANHLSPHAIGCCKHLGSILRVFEIKQGN